MVYGHMVCGHDVLYGIWSMMYSRHAHGIMCVLIWSMMCSYDVWTMMCSYGIWSMMCSYGIWSMMWSYGILMVNDMLIWSMVWSYGQ